MKKYKNIITLFVFVALLVSLSCSSDNEVDNSIDNNPVVNKQEFKILVNGDEREYIVYVPSTYDKNNNYPVVFHLHGGSGDGEKHYNISGWNELAETNGFLVVYPTAWTYDLNNNGCGNAVVTRWNSFKLENEVCSGATLKDDIAFFNQMIDEVTINFSTEQSKIYVSGFSNGGGMASKLAIELSDRLVAIGIMAGTLPQNDTYTPARILPIQLMIGTDDDKINEVTGFDVLPMDFSQVFADSYIDGLMQTWINSFDLDSNYTVIDSLGSEITAKYQGNTNSTNHLLKFTLLEDVPHIFYNPDVGIGSADILWEFFKDYQN